jgi:type II secretory pathway component HofQ
MTIQRSLIACAMFAASISAGYAGPCSQEIARLQAAIDAKIAAATATGSSARESTAATMHRQPTPHSIATAESELGDVSPEQVKAVTALMARAREADSAGDESACNQALADTRRALK